MGIGCETALPARWILPSLGNQPQKQPGFLVETGETRRHFMKQFKFTAFSACVTALVLSSGLTPSFSADLPLPPAPLAIVKLLVPDPTAFAPNSSGAFTILRSERSPTELTVAIDIGGTAVNGVDYDKLPALITIPANLEAVDLIVRPLPTAPLSAVSKTVTVTLKPDAGYVIATKKASTVTLAQDLYNNDPPTVSITSPAEGALVTGPVINLSAEAADAEDGIASVSFFAGDSLVGISSAPPFSVPWTNRSVLRKYPIFARAVDKIGQTTLSKVVNVTVSNTPVSVVLVAPANGAGFPVGNIALSATVAGDPVPVARVEFSANGVVVGSASTTPYNVVWPNTKPGRYQISARAIDAFGVAGESAKSTILVSNVVPVVKLTAPAEGAKSSVKDAIQFAATATDATSPINRVDFYVDHKLVGISSNAPYQFLWAKPTPGSHSLIARAYDNAGAAANSPTVNFTVTNLPPKVVLVSPVKGQVVTLPAIVELTANPTPGDAPIVFVNFWADYKLVGTATNPPYTVKWTNPPVGAYAVSAHVKDAVGAVTVSDTVVFQVIKGPAH